MRNVAGDCFCDATAVTFMLGAGERVADQGVADYCRLVAYGDDVDICLNGMSVRFAETGGKRRALLSVAWRGAPLDDALNTNTAIALICRGGIGFAGRNSTMLKHTNPMLPKAGGEPDTAMCQDD